MSSTLAVRLLYTLWPWGVLKKSKEIKSAYNLNINKISATPVRMASIQDTDNTSAGKAWAHGCMQWAEGVVPFSMEDGDASKHSHSGRQPGCSAKVQEVLYHMTQQLSLSLNLPCGVGI